MTDLPQCFTLKNSGGKPRMKEDPYREGLQI
jgi:hypothetical protein